MPLSNNQGTVKHRRYAVMFNDKADSNEDKDFFYS